MPTIKGTASVADARARKKAMKRTKFPSSFSKAVDLQRVNRAVLTQWIEQKVTTILGFDDEIVSSTAINLFLPAEGEDPPDPKRAQLDLAGFLGEDESASFAKELWKLMVEAQESSSGIPKTLLEQKKKELAEKAAEQKPNAHVPSRPIQDYVQEAKNRAKKALEVQGSTSSSNSNGNPARNDNHGRWQDRPQPPGPAEVPLSPTQDAAQHSNNANVEDDRRMAPPQLDQFGRAVPRNANHDFPQSNRGVRPVFSQDYTPGSSRRNRDNQGRAWAPPDDRRRPDYHRRGREDDGRRYDGNRRRYDDRGPPPRYDDRRQYDRRDRRYHEDREFEELERRLVVMKKQLSRRSDDRRLRSEIEDIEERLYNLEQRRRRSFRDGGDGGYRRRDGRGSPEDRRRSSRSPERGSRRKRSDSTDSDHSSASSRSRGSSGVSEDDDDSSRSRSRSSSVSRSRSASRSRSPHSDRS